MRAHASTGELRCLLVMLPPGQGCSSKFGKTLWRLGVWNGRGNGKKGKEKKSHLIWSVMVCVNGRKLKKIRDGILFLAVGFDSCTLGDTAEKGAGVNEFMCVQMFLCSMESVLAVCCSARTMYSICTCSSTKKAPARHADRYSTGGERTAKKQPFCRSTQRQLHRSQRSPDGTATAKRGRGGDEGVGALWWPVRRF